MDSIIEILKVLNNFRDEREWGQFHNSKDLAIAISIEKKPKLNKLKMNWLIF